MNGCASGRKRSAAGGADSQLGTGGTGLGHRELTAPVGMARVVPVVPQR